MGPNIFFTLQKQDYILQVIPTGPLEANCIIISSLSTKAALIIDPGNDIQIISHFLESLALKVEMIIHTHAHYDHIGQTSTLQSKYNCQIMLHQTDLPLYSNIENQGYFFGEKVAPPSNAIHFFEDGNKIEFPSSNIFQNEKKYLHVLHTPGHSPGSTCFFTDFFDKPIVISGDTLFSGAIGRTDLPGGSQKQIIESIKNKLYTLPPETIIIAGHGPCSTIASEIESNPYVN